MSSDDYDKGVLVTMKLYNVTDAAAGDGPFSQWIQSLGLDAEEIRSTIAGDAVGAGYADRTGGVVPTAGSVDNVNEVFTWLSIGAEDLKSNKSPSSLVQDAFDKLGSGHDSAGKNKFATLVAALNTSYVGQAVLAWLPKTTAGGSTSDIYSFLDHKAPFGLSYGWDVFGNIGQTSAAEINAASAGLTLGAPEYASEWSAISGGEYTNAEQYRYYPPYRKDDTGNLSWKKSWADQRFKSSTTYCIEAIGIDYMDTTVVGVTGELVSTDNNYLLSSNEIFPVDPNIREWSFTWTSMAMDGDEFVINWGDTSPGNRLTKLFKARYTARAGSYLGTFTRSELIKSTINGTNGLGNSPPAGDTAPWNPRDSRLGTHLWEKDALEIAIKKMCKRIQDGYEIVDLPKKLLNKVQKKGKIPDGIVSAFGYVPPDDDAYRTMIAGTEGMASGLQDALQINIGDVQYGTDDYDPDSAISYTQNPGPWTYTENVGGEQVTRSVTWEDYVAAGEGSESGFETGTFGGGPGGSDGGGVY